MGRETISDKQGISIIILFMASTSTILTFGLLAGTEVWLAIILSMLIAMIIALIFIRLHSIFPTKNFIDVCEICCGKFIGRGIILVFTWFVFHEGVLVLINTHQFIIDNTLSETPSIVIVIPFILLCVWITKEGIEVIGRWAKASILPFIIFAFSIALFLIPKLELTNIQPILYNGIKPLIKGTFASFSFPFGEIVMLAMVFSDFRTKNSSFKIYFIGLLIGGIVLLTTSLTTVLVMGIDLTSSSYFPTYEAVKKINIGNIFQRVELLSALIFLLGAFVKASILLLATCKGIVKIFVFDDYRFMVIPIALLMINLSLFLHKSRMDYVAFTFKVWTYYAIPFEVFIPIVILIIAEIKKKGLN